MARLIIIFIFLFSSVFAQAQLELISLSHNFGVLRRADPNWTDFEVRNTGKKEEVLFRLEAPKSVKIIFGAKTVKPDSTVRIRVQYSPTSPGAFDVSLKLYASAWQIPKVISLTGESTYTTETEIPCPDFSETSGGGAGPLFISVRDSATSKLIPYADIQIFREGRKQTRLTADVNGEVEVTLIRDRYYFLISDDGSATDTALYVNAVNNHLMVLLPRNEKVQSATTVPPAPLPPELPETPPVFVKTEIDSEELPLSLYKESNVVFLVDVSSSMYHNGRLDLLKVAMIDLLDVLRPVDRFALISYSSTTSVLIETRYNLDKKACADAIASLKAGGSTAGADAIDAAGEQSLEQFIAEGNNQIILATDGAFSDGDEKASRIASRLQRKGITISVLGIKSSSSAEKFMIGLAADGGGRYIDLESPSDAGRQLINEIKISAHR